MSFFSESECLKCLNNQFDTSVNPLVLCEKTDISLSSLRPV